MGRYLRGAVDGGNHQGCGTRRCWVIKNQTEDTRQTWEAGAFVFCDPTSPFSCATFIFYQNLFSKRGV